MAVHLTKKKKKKTFFPATQIYKDQDDGTDAAAFTTKLFTEASSASAYVQDALHLLTPFFHIRLMAAANNRAAA
jgi:hypothetical protein